METTEIELHSAPLYLKVYSLLKDWILGGRLVPGARIGETALALELRVSRTPVRDALRRLEQDRLIVPVPGPAYEVYRPTAADLADLYTARALLEGGAARLAAERRPDGAVDRLAAIVAAMREAYGQAPESRVADLDTQFHETLVAAGQNPVLIELHNHLSTRLRHVRTLSGDFSLRRQLVLDQHTAIVDALHTGSGEVAEAATRSHILFIYAAVRAEIGKRTIP